MNLQTIVAELKNERDRIDRAIAALDQTSTRRTGRTPAKATKAASAGTRRGSRKGHLTAAGRRRLSQLMKQRWAERRRKGGNGRKTASQAA
jgi:hypothetical protein